MSDNAEFKALVRRRMDATGEKYTTAYRALLDAARPAVFPLSGRQILPRIAARFADSAPKPDSVRVRLRPEFELHLDEAELAQYAEADEGEREELVLRWLDERFYHMLVDDDLIADHAVVYEDQRADESIRREADDLGITADQYAWLWYRLTDEEFEQLTDDAMYRLLADEYTEYPSSDNR